MDLGYGTGEVRGRKDGREEERGRERGVGGEVGRERCGRKLKGEIIKFVVADYDLLPLGGTAE
jgi:hypothetical protein